MNQIPEPMLPVDLEDNDDLPAREWTAQALTELARQLGVMNDYYYPLIRAAIMIRRTEAAAEIERLRADLETAKKLLDEDADEIERLRGELHACGLDNEIYFNRCEELADEIERLRTALANATRTVGDANTAAGIERLERKR